MPSSLLLAGIAGFASGGFTIAGFSWLAFGSSLALNALSRITQKQPQAAQFTGGGGQMVNLRQPVPPRQVIFGEARVGGPVTFAEVSNSDLWLVITLSGHPVAAIPEIYFGDDRVPFVTDAPSPSYPGVLTGPYANVTALTRALGSESGQPFPGFIAQTTAWTDSMRQSGCAKVAWRLVAAPGYWTSGVPTLTAHVRGALVYDPRSGDTEWTNNPALLAAHYLCHTDYGLGADFGTEIDADDLEAAADVCDERVRINGLTGAFTADADTDVLTFASATRNPITRTGVRLTTTDTLPAGLATGTTYYCIYRGFGRVQLAASDDDARNGVPIDITDVGIGEHTLQYWDEPRYMANGAFTVDVEPRAVLVSLAAAMAGRITNPGGIWHISAGAYEAPTIELDEDDLAGPITVVTALSGRDTANGVKGTYVNPAQFWQPDDFPQVDSDTYLAEDGGVRSWREIDLTAFVASRSQAQRLAKIELLSVRQGLTVEAEFELTAWAAMTGRTVGLTNARFGWDNKAFEVVQSGFAVKPAAQTEDGATGEGSVLHVKLTLRETAAAIYDWATDEESTEDLAPNTTLDFSIGDPGAPSVTAEAYTVRDGQALAVRAIVSFEQSAHAFGPSYALEYKLSADSDWTVLPLVKAAAGSTGPMVVTINDIVAGTYDFRVKAFGIDGRQSDYATTSNVSINPTAGAPADITGFRLNVANGLAHLTWDQVADLDVRVGGYVRIRWSPLTSGATWANAVNIGPSIPGIATQAVLPLQSGTYLVKAVDSSRRSSANAALIVTNAPNVIRFNVVDTIAEHSGSPHWEGTKTSVVYDASLDGLKLDVAPGSPSTGLNPTGTYDFYNTIDLGAVYTSRLSATIRSAAYVDNDLISARTDNITLWPSIVGDSVDDADVQLYVRTTSDTPTGSPTPTWGEWTPFVVGDYTARAFEFKVEFETADSNHNVVLTEATVRCNMPDRVEGADDIASGAGAKVITFDEPFYAKPAIGITAQNMATGDYFAVTSAGATGFTVTFRNSGGTAVDRTFDWMAKGYGALVT